MKKSMMCSVLIVLLVSMFPLQAKSYENNEFQRKSLSYTRMATAAYDEGDYEGALEYAKQAEIYADLSSAFIERMLARADAEKMLFQARTRFAWAQGIRGERFFPGEMETASAYIEDAATSFSAEEYGTSRSQSEKALAALSAVSEKMPLPATWKVDLWNESRDCLWNIAAHPAVYGNPFMWVKLWEANRSTLRRPANPHLLLPSQVIKIPSIQGEYREGQFDRSARYEPFMKK